MREEAVIPPASADALPSPRRMSGKRVMLAIVLGIPLVLVPLLLSGPAHRRAVCLNTLAQRETAAFTVGSLPVAGGDPRAIDEWPRPPMHPHLLDKVGGLPAASPAAWHRAMGADAEGTMFMDVERTMPFALFVQIPNTRALAPSRAAIVEMRLLAAAVLDPADAADRACWQRLDANLREGLDRLNHLTRREKRHPPVTPAERFAERVLPQCLDALSADDPRSAVREALCAEGK